jgi:hypothetical protein
MHKLKLGAAFLAVLLVAVPFTAGVSQADDNTYTLQYITTASGINYVGFLQSISGCTVSSFGASDLVNVGFDNVTVNGLYNRAIGVGNYRNQGSVAFVNIEPNQKVNPVTFSGQMTSQNNQVAISDYNYGVNLNFNGFHGTGIVVLDVMAGSFSNQFTSLTFNMGKGAIPATAPSSVFSAVQGNPSTIVSLSNEQMQATTATSNNDFKYRGTRSAVTSMQGVPDIQGISAITMSAGINNQVNHHVEFNIDTGK